MVRMDFLMCVCVCVWVLPVRTQGRERRPVLAATSEASYEFLSSRGRTCSNRLSMDTISTQSRICSRWASCVTQTNIHDTSTAFFPKAADWSGSGVKRLGWKPHWWRRAEPRRRSRREASVPIDPVKLEFSPCRSNQELSSLLLASEHGGYNGVRRLLWLPSQVIFTGMYTTLKCLLHVTKDLKN